MNTNNLIDIQDKLIALESTFKSAIIDFERYYILSETERQNQEYKNFFNSVKYEIQNYSEKLFNMSTQIINELSNMETTVVDKSNKLENQKKLHKELLNIYKNLEQKQNGSSLFINNSKQLYNQQYYKNIHLLVGIGGIISLLIYLSKKKQ